MKLNIQFLWDEAKTRKLFRAYLIMFVCGLSAAIPFILTYKYFAPFNLVLAGLPGFLLVLSLFNLLIINKFDSRIKFVIYLFVTQIVAAIFLGLSSGFTGIFQFGPYLLLIFSLFELGTDITVILGIFSILSFIGTLYITSIVNPHPTLLFEFFYYVGAYTIILFLERNVGKELSLQIEAKKRMEEVDDMKNQFITLTSHYLRTPLTIIKGFASRLPDLTDGKQSEEISLFKSSIGQLEIFVEKLLLISTIEKGEVKLALVKTDLTRLIKALCQEFDPQAKESSINLTCKTPEGAVESKIDYVKLKEAIGSLLDNAIRFNDRAGKVELILSQEQGNIKIIISNTGKGISSDHLNNLFNPFNKGGMDQVIVQDKPGVGLSLYLAKLIINAHQGTITVKSVPNQVTTFSILLPKKE